MAYVETWDETLPDGASQQGNILDDDAKSTKRAVRERLEGDEALNGLVVTFDPDCKPKKGMARTFIDLDANKGAAPLEDGRVFTASDLFKVYLLLTAGIEEIAYLDLDGTQAMLADLDMGGFNVTNLGTTSPPSGQLSKSGDQVYSASQSGAISWETEDFDVGNLLNAAGNTIVIPSGEAGVYEFSATLEIGWGHSSGIEIGVTRNGTPIHTWSHEDSGHRPIGLSWRYNASVADYFAITLNNLSVTLGVTVEETSIFGAHKVAIL